MSFGGPGFSQTSGSSSGPAVVPALPLQGQEPDLPCRHCRCHSAGPGFQRFPDTGPGPAGGKARWCRIGRCLKWNKVVPAVEGHGPGFPGYLNPAVGCCLLQQCFRNHHPVQVEGVFDTDQPYPGRFYPAQASDGRPDGRQVVRAGNREDRSMLFSFPVFTKLAVLFKAGGKFQHGIEF